MWLHNNRNLLWLGTGRAGLFSLYQYIHTHGYTHIKNNLYSHLIYFPYVSIWFSNGRGWVPAWWGHHHCSQHNCTAGNIQHLQQKHRLGIAHGHMEAEAASSQSSPNTVSLVESHQWISILVWVKYRASHQKRHHDH